jgi:farnesyl diphosphate synthase
MPATERAAFEKVFPSLAEDILAYAKTSNLPENAVQWFKQV